MSRLHICVEHFGKLCNTGNNCLNAANQLGEFHGDDYELKIGPYCDFLPPPLERTNTSVGDARGTIERD